MADAKLWVEYLVIGLITMIGILIQMGFRNGYESAMRNSDHLFAMLLGAAWPLTFCYYLCCAFKFFFIYIPLKLGEEFQNMKPGDKKE